MLIPAWNVSVDGVPFSSKLTVYAHQDRGNVWAASKHRGSATGPEITHGRDVARQVLVGDESIAGALVELTVRVNWKTGVLASKNQCRITRKL